MTPDPNAPSWDRDQAIPDCLRSTTRPEDVQTEAQKIQAAAIRDLKEAEKRIREGPRTCQVCGAIYTGPDHGSYPGWCLNCVVAATRPVPRKGFRTPREGVTRRSINRMMLYANDGSPGGRRETRRKPMSLTILKTPDGKIVRINPDSDVRLYDAPTNPPNTGTKYTRGTDLYAHKARSGAVYYYLYHWSMWQGEESRYELINADAAREVLLTCATYSDHRALTEKEVSLAEEHFPGIFEETA